LRVHGRRYGRDPAHLRVRQILRVTPDAPPRLLRPFTRVARARVDEMKRRLFPALLRYWRTRCILLVGGPRRSGRLRVRLPSHRGPRPP
jgi:hypothetical protein